MRACECVRHHLKPHLKPERGFDFCLLAQQLPKPKRQSRQTEAISGNGRVMDGILNAMLPDLWSVMYMIHSFGLICTFALIAD